MALLRALCGQNDQQIACCRPAGVLDAATNLIIGDAFIYSIEYLGVPSLFLLDLITDDLRISLTTGVLFPSLAAGALRAVPNAEFFRLDSLLAAIIA